MSIIPTAFAADAATNPAQQGDFMRPNNKKRKEMQKLLDNLAVGDEVLTNGGIAGRIVKLPDNKEYVLVSVSSGVVMQIKRNYVVAVLPKGTLEAVAVDKSVSTPKNSK